MLLVILLQLYVNTYPYANLSKIVEVKGPVQQYGNLVTHPKMDWLCLDYR